MNTNAINSIKVDLRTRALRVSYVHPDSPSEDLCIEIKPDDCNLVVLADFLNACFPERDFHDLTEAKAKCFFKAFYQDVTDRWLKDSSNFLLKKAGIFTTV